MMNEVLSISTRTIGLSGIGAKFSSPSSMREQM